MSLSCLFHIIFQYVNLRLNEFIFLKPICAKLADVDVVFVRGCSFSKVHSCILLICYNITIFSELIFKVGF
jgi:hypothetical protein